MSETSRELKDAYGRSFLNFRISVTQRCNLSCPFCHGEGQSDSNEEMTPTEISMIARAGARLGARKVKITGGEPLLRDDLAEIVKQLSQAPEIKEISMVTNATLLNNELAGQLKKNGLKRLNINIPSVEPETYRRLTGGNLSRALSGIWAAKTAGISPIKINMLILAEENDKQVEGMIEFTRKMGAILQIIELEPLKISSQYYRKHHLDLEQIERKISRDARFVKVREHMQGRRIYSLAGLDVEIVRPVENTEFCLHCTRMRLTSDGKIKLCLMRNDLMIDLLPILRSGRTEIELEEAIIAAVKQRKPFYGEISSL